MFELFFGEYLVEKNYITQEQLDEVIEIQKSSRVKLGLIAVAEKMLTQSQADSVNMLQATLDKRFGDIAVEKGYLTDEQVGKLLSLQGNPYMKFTQTVIEKNIMTLEQIEKYVQEYKNDNSFSDNDIDAIKSGDVDRIINVFIRSSSAYYDDYMGLAIRNIVRFITTSFSFKAPKKVNTYEYKYLGSQCVKGDHNVFTAFASNDNALVEIANPYADENYTEVDDDAYDAICEFINCINGLFASKLSTNGIDIDMLPPLTYNDGKLQSSEGFYVLPIKINNKCLDFVIAIDAELEIQ